VSLAGLLMIALAACGSTRDLAGRLGTTKNPYPVAEKPGKKHGDNAINPFILKNYEILVDLLQESSSLKQDKAKVELFLRAGFALSDHYCRAFFRDADESQRRRTYGRAIWNDAGTAISTVLGLANAGENVVTGVAAGFGLGDSAWRNYDQAFVVAPDLSIVKSLVEADMGDYRRRISTGEIDLPDNYQDAQSMVEGYADKCSTLDMKKLLNQSVEEKRAAIEEGQPASPEIERTNPETQVPSEAPPAGEQPA